MPEIGIQDGQHTLKQHTKSQRASFDGFQNANLVQRWSPHQEDLTKGNGQGAWILGPGGGVFRRNLEYCLGGVLRILTSPPADFVK